MVNPSDQLLVLLAPIQTQALRLAHRLCDDPADADDLFQDAVARALAKLSSLRNHDRFRSWFFAILLNLHRSQRTRGFWRRLSPLRHEPHAQQSTDNSHVRQALATLKRPQRQAIILHDIHGYSVAEIADMQRVTVSAVKSRLSRGREKLRAYYQRQNLAERRLEKGAVS
jgi:RNA polymerase sigma-70 factor (ECF subfamily)